MSAWRQAAIDAFPEAKREFLAMASVEDVWPFLLPQLEAAVKGKDRAVFDQFLKFAEWVLTPRPGSRPESSLQALTDPVVAFIVAHVSILFEGRSRQEFFRIQPGLRYHLPDDKMSVFDAFLERTPKYVR